MGNKQAKPTKKKTNAAELTEEEIELLLNNTHFNRKQIEEWHSGFIKDCPKGPKFSKYSNILRQI